MTEREDLQARYVAILTQARLLWMDCQHMMLRHADPNRDVTEVLDLCKGLMRRALMLRRDNHQLQADLADAQLRGEALGTKFQDVVVPDFMPEDL